MTNILYNSFNLSNQPLEVRVENNRLEISIGIDTLAFAAEDNDSWHEWDGKQFVPIWKVVDNKGWAKDVAHEMQKDQEDGSSPLTNFLDKMFEKTIDQGSLSVWSPELGTPDPEDEDV